MLTKGFEATSIDEICEAAHITKGALFYHFKNKEALGVATVNYHMEMGQQMMVDAPFLKKKDPLKKLTSYIDFIIGVTIDPIKEGCLLGVLSQELGSTKNSIVECCHNGFVAWQSQLVDMIEEARLKHAPRKKLDSLGLAQQFLATYEGAIVLAKASNDCTIVKKMMMHYKNYLVSLLAVPS